MATIIKESRKRSNFRTHNSMVNLQQQRKDLESYKHSFGAKPATPGEQPQEVSVLSAQTLVYFRIKTKEWVVEP